MQHPMSLNGYSWVEGNTPNDAVGEPGFHNRYSYAGGNPVNRVDRNGMCWTNVSASPSQQDQCRAAWDTYTEIVTDTFGRNWPRDVRILMTQEARYWSGLSYNEFMNQWNSSRPPAQSNNLREYAGYALGGAAVSGGPGIEDALFLIGAACLFAASMTPSSTIALPMRQPYYFAESRDRAGERDDSIPLPRYGDCTRAQHNRLQNDVNRRCKERPTRCTSSMRCRELRSRRRRNRLCAEARERINRRCYRGGDEGHQRAAESYRDAFDTCNEIFQNKCS